MRRYMAGLFGLYLMVGLATPVVAQHAQPDRQQHSGPAKQQGSSRQIGDGSVKHSGPNRQAEDRQDQRSSSRYGNWDQKWGSRPGTPPKHWTRTSDWYRHVRACQQRFRSYDSRSDTYRLNSGQRKRCTL